MSPRLVLLLCFSACVATAGRPDAGTDLFNYSSTDVLKSVDGPTGAVRVHYSVSGPNVTLLIDSDGSGVPDFAELVAATAEEVLALFEKAGFERPLSEALVGLGDLGGSPAFDFYLLDYGGGADGQYASDGCKQGVCAGHMVMENDFKGYGYSSLKEAVKVLTSHELFHAVQAAYVPNLPVWVSEGTATWAERLFEPDVADFLAFSNAYLADTGRSLDRPPTGPVPAFAYGTCLFWEFLSQRHGNAVVRSVLEASVKNDGVDAVTVALVASKTTLSEEWLAFVAANLATGTRAGKTAVYPFAAKLAGVTATATGSSLERTDRFYPLAASYYVVEHGGGALGFASDDDATGLVFSLAPIESGKVGAVLQSWSPTTPALVALGDRPAGNYWLWGTYPEQAANSRRIHFCVGPPVALAPCAPPVTPEPVVAIAEPDPTTPEPVPPEPQVSAEPVDSAASNSSGGACGVGGHGGGLPGLLSVALIAWLRRRRALAA